jgi:protein-S-isoprenylcysteine O-methyltransferase Ste14
LVLWTAGLFAVQGRGTPLPLDPPRTLVVAGPYRYVRNPMYVGALLALLGYAAWFQSAWLLGYAGAVALAFHAFVVLYEEPHLGRVFGEAYRRYCEAVPRWGVRWRADG